MVDPISAIGGAAALGGLYLVRRNGYLTGYQDAEDELYDLDEVEETMSAMQRTAAVRNDLDEAEQNGGS